ncbi:MULTISPECIES: hypothetical protein [Paenibacillus]|uniref:Uncharacterized protein n=1 Tax=Paenibacillus agri TaxID=2744309 RepID=A0A850ER97_9BACL|nr:hypothetical protein [Paenibacillus agri]NUU60551.1 hypothetical protein [Paenibacillus agri]
MGDRLWKWYRFTFIQTPIAALVIIALLVAGMYALMTRIEIRQYSSALGTIEAGTHAEVTYLTVLLERGTPELQSNDEVVWYTEESGNRYPAKVDSIHEEERGTVVRIQVEPAEWDRASAEGSGKQKPYVVEIPIGKQTVMQRLFQKGERDEE